MQLHAERARQLGHLLTHRRDASGQFLTLEPAFRAGVSRHDFTRRTVQTAQPGFVHRATTGTDRRELLRHLGLQAEIDFLLQVVGAVGQATDGGIRRLSRENHPESDHR